MSKKPESVSVKTESQLKTKKDWGFLIVAMLGPIVLFGLSIIASLDGHSISGAILCLFSILLGAIVIIADNDDSIWIWNAPAGERW